MKLLYGSELAGFIKERQAKQLRALKQTVGMVPRLAIVSTTDHPAIEVYMRMKKRYGADIGVDVDIHRADMATVEEVINELNKDESVQAIIIQLPLADPSKTDRLTNLVLPSKDVDGLNADSKFEPATPMAILWLLAGYNITLDKNSQVVIFGSGKLVGKPLAKILRASKVPVEVIDSTTEEVGKITSAADIIISGVGKPGLLTSDLIPDGCTVIDAGVASEGGNTVGDVASSVYETRDDVKITPAKGGVGPLTVCALFDNVIRATSNI